MKCLSVVRPFLPLALLGFILAAGCGKQPAPSAEQPKAAPRSPPPIVSAEPNSFQQVTSRLDPGGQLYLYLSTEKWLEGLSTKVSEWRSFAGAIPDLKADDRGNILKVFDIVTNLIKSSGIEEISGLGMSTIAREKGLYQTKVVVHHYNGKGSGCIWSVFGQKPHTLNGLSLLSTNAALAAFFDLQLPLVWAEVQKQVGQARFPQAQEALTNLTEGFAKATGLQLDTVLRSLGGEFGFALTLDDTRKISIPLPGAGPMEIPEPGLMLIAKVSDDTIYNRVDAVLKKSQQQVIRVEKPNLKMLTVPLPLPLPIVLRPTLASSGGYLLLATSDGLVQEALDVKAGRTPGLKSSPEFQRLAMGLPENGNQFAFMSQRFGQAFIQIQQQALEMNKQMPPGAAGFLRSFLDPDNATQSFSVSANTDEGWISISTGNRDSAKILAASAIVAPVGLLSAIAIPSFVKARQTAQKNACINNLRRIDGAKAQWALAKNKTGSDRPSRAELLEFLGGDKFPTCPVGGRYTINSVSSPPECSIQGHSLPK